MTKKGVCYMCELCKNKVKIHLDAQGDERDVLEVEHIFGCVFLFKAVNHQKASEMEFDFCPLCGHKLTR